MCKKIFLVLIFFSSLVSGARTAVAGSTFDQSLEAQYQKSSEWLNLNLSPTNSVPGSIVAAPSYDQPNYYFHWIRDAALTTSGLIGLYSKSQGRLRSNLKEFFLAHIRFNALVKQGLHNDNFLGEPKFNMDGSVYTGPWGRPQNDGPALRSLTMIDLLSLMEKESWPEASTLIPQLYDGAWPSKSLIKADLEYTAHHWSDLCFDLWEEVNGLHFYTLMAQRKSLQSGAQLARSQKDPGAAEFYLKQVASIDLQLNQFWNAKQGFVLTTLFPQFSLFGGIASPMQFRSQLDSAVILAVLHSEIADDSFSIDDDRILATYQKLRESFASAYAINKIPSQGKSAILTKNLSLGTAFGRYPEDTYNGYETNGLGNPWVLTTAGAAEFLYRLIEKLQSQGSIAISSTNIRFYQDVSKVKKIEIGPSGKLGAMQFRAILKGLFAEADSLMARVLYHRNPDGSLSEQINRQNGYMQGAPNLTWSHVSFITAKNSRDRVEGFFK